MNLFVILNRILILTKTLQNDIKIGRYLQHITHNFRQ